MKMSKQQPAGRAAPRRSEWGAKGGVGGHEFQVEK